MLDPLFRAALVACACLFALSACGDDGASPANDAGPASDDGGVPLVDTDRDGLPDEVEEAGCSFVSVFDTDRDGLSDGEDVALGLDPCEADSDGDGVDDLGELAYHRAECPEVEPAAGTLCDAPAGFSYVRLELGRGNQTLPFTFDTTIRDLDVFVLLDLGTDGDPNVADPLVGVWDVLSESFDSVWLGVGAYQDFPIAPWGADVSGDTLLDLATAMRPLAERATVEAAVDGLIVRGGGDPAGSATESLYRLITGEPETFTSGESSYPWSPPACPAGRYGAACFREEALPVVALFPVFCTHEGPPEAVTPLCDNYTGITPEPKRWDEMVRALSERGVVPIGGLPPGARRCDLSAPTASSAPCLLLDRYVRELGVPLEDGSITTYVVPEDANDAGNRFAGLVERAVRESRSDVSAGVTAVGEPDVPLELLIGALAPTCAALGPDVPPESACWTPPEGTDVGDAVGQVEPGGFLGVREGTKLDFELVLTPPRRGEPTARVAVLSVRFERNGATRETERVVVGVASTQPF